MGSVKSEAEGVCGLRLEACLCRESAEVQVEVFGGERCDANVRQEQVAQLLERVRKKVFIPCRVM